MTDLVDDLDTVVAAACAALRGRRSTATGTCRPPGSTGPAANRRARRRRPVRLRRRRSRRARPELDDLRAVRLSRRRPDGEPECTSTPSADAGNAASSRCSTRAAGCWSAVAGTPTGRRRAVPPLRRLATPTASRRWAPSRRCSTCTTSRAARPRVGPRPGRRTPGAGAALPGRTGRRDPWPTLLRVTGRDPAAPAGAWRWDGTVRGRTGLGTSPRAGPRRSASRSAKQRRSSAVSSWAREKPRRRTPTISLRCHCSANSSSVSGDSGSGRPPAST